MAKKNFANELFLKHQKTYLLELRRPPDSADEVQKRIGYHEGLLRLETDQHEKDGHNLMIEHLKEIKREFETSLKNDAIKKEKQAYTYKWPSNPDKELPKLYSQMIGKFIDQNTTLNQFNAIFTGQSANEISPIKWLSSNKLLAYFLDQSFKGKYWQSIAGNGKLFLNSDGKNLTANDLAVAKSQFKWSLPIGHERIDKILKAIQND